MFIGMSSAYVIIMRNPFSSFLLVMEMTGRYTILLPSLCVGIMGYVLISATRAESLGSYLYKQLLKRFDTLSNTHLNFNTEVMPFSYFEGKTSDTIKLPEGCVLHQIVRDNHPMKLAGDIYLQEGDQLEFHIQSTDIEKIYQALISLSTDPR